MKKKFWLMLMIPLLCFPSCSNGGSLPKESDEATGKSNETLKDEYYVLPMDTYLDKTTAGFLGQLVGFFSGYEFVYWSDGRARVAMPDDWFEMCNGPYANPNPHKTHADKLLYNSQTGLWEAWMDDDYSIDILNQYILRDMYAQYGTIASKVITDDWVKYDVYDMGGGHRSVGAYGLMNQYRYLPEFAGSWEFGNRYSYCFEPCIENETLGMIAAGMPDVTADITDIFARVTSEQDPVIWAKFFSTLYSLAYMESDIPTLIRQAQQLMPKDSYTYSVIDGVFALRERYPNDWRSAVQAAEQQFARHHDRMVRDKTLEPNVNSAFVLIAWLYGEGDYTETCKIVSLAGYDGDSTAAICMGLMGVLGGMETLPSEAHELLWQNGEGVIVNLEYPNTATGYWMCMKNLPERMKITDIVDMYRQNFEHVLLEYGGRIENGLYYIPKRELGAAESVYFEDFEQGSLDTYTVYGGKAELFEGGFEGKYTAKLFAGETESSGMYTVIDGLTVGEQYRVSCFVNTSTRRTAQIFVREPGKEGVFATVYDSDKYILRRFVFTATAEQMEFGIQLLEAGNPFSYVTLDYISICHIRETPAAQVEIVSDAGQDKGYSGKIEFAVRGKAAREVLLKLTFANISHKTVNAAVTVNGDNFNTAPIYRTGDIVFENGADTVYIPILLSQDVNTVALDIPDSTVHILSAEVVTVQDRW